MNEQEIRAIIRSELEEFLATDRYIFNKKVQFLDGRNIQLGLSTGTKIGTATGHKLGFFNKTPVIQQSSPSSLATVGTDVDGVARTAINTLRTSLINLGLIA